MSFVTLLLIVFWLTVLLIVYTYVGYPLIIALIGRVRPLPVRTAAVRPSVSLVIAAYNEAHCIERKLENCIGLDYPKDRLEVVLASDGSTDRTAEIGRRFKQHGVSVIEFPVRRGKPSLLNDVIPQCRGDIVVLSDARQRYDERAVAMLVENFADLRVGAVSGELHLVNDGGSSVGDGVGAYWRYEKFIRRWESQIDSTIGATGAIYAIRRQIFAPLPPDTLLDDVLIPMRITATGLRVVFEPRALAFDRAAETSGEEFTRKLRTIAGNIQLAVREPWCCNPRRNRLWIQFISHKILRLLMPLLLIVAAAANVLLSSAIGYRVILAGQLMFYGLAVAGACVARRYKRWRWLMLPYGFCLLNLAALVSLVCYIFGRQKVTWDKAVADPDEY